jgi:dihydrolipoamide dehydrogenase
VAVRHRVAAAQLNLSVALIDKDELGGTCLHRGCIPTKALLHAGEIADQTRESEQFGVKADSVGIDMAGVNAYKDGVVGRLYKGLQGLLKQRQDHHVPARASWSADHRRGRRPALHRPQRRPRHRLLLALAARPRGRRQAGAASEHALKLDRVPPPRSCSAAA